MWEYIAKEVGIPWYQVETKFWHLFREKPGLSLNRLEKEFDTSSPTVPEAITLVGLTPEKC